MGYSDSLKRAIDEVIAPAACQVDRARKFPRPGIEALGAAGILGLTVPAAQGGGGQGLPEAADAVTEVARACGSTAMILTAHFAATAVLAVHGPRPVLAEIAAGRHLSTLAFSEAGARSRFLSPSGMASPDGEWVRLDTGNSRVTSAGHADSYVWSSRPVAAEGAMTLWLVPSGSPGLTIPAFSVGMGLRGNASAAVPATAVRVPAGARLGADGAGLDIALATAVPWFLVLSAAASAGLMEAVIAATGEHLARTKLVHLNQTLADRPGKRAGLARMRIAADSARRLLDDAIAALAARQPDARLRALEVKAAAAEASIAVTDLAMTLCGGSSFRTDLGVERRFRDALAARMMAAGTAAGRPGLRADQGGEQVVEFGGGVVGQAAVHRAGLHHGRPGGGQPAEPLTQRPPGERTL
jgi:alkylation response protein AidB-like acyl-CoA dehydrogenase